MSKYGRILTGILRESSENRPQLMHSTDVTHLAPDMEEAPGAAGLP